ncbi:MAG: hypothetical protein WC796_05845 [Candidatus Pacearchaeota archaeon]|jgi:hypothetical protein
MKYCFNLKVQAMYGIVTFLAAFGIIYLVSKELDWTSSLIIGVLNFAISGFYERAKIGKCKK